LIEGAAAKQPPFRHELERRGRGFQEFRAPFLKSGNSVMPRPRGKRSPLELEVAEEIRAAKYREQDAEFCRALRTALWAEKEFCPEGVSKEPGTKKPFLLYRRPD